jgi:hypothetical protein
VLKDLCFNGKKCFAWIAWDPRLDKLQLDFSGVDAAKGPTKKVSSTPFFNLAGTEKPQVQIEKA